MKMQSKFKEGDDYFAVEVNPEGEHVIALSCWDDQSEEISNPHVFATLREALNYLHTNGVREATYYDYRNPYGTNLTV